MRNAWMLSATLALAATPALAIAAPAPLASAIAEGDRTATEISHDGVVEAIRQTVVSAQVPGAIVTLAVKPGDRVTAGQLLARIDSHAADQNAIATDATVRAAKASLDVATKDFERQRQLYDKHYISQAALERAEAQFKATQAQVAAQLAQAGAAHIEAGLHTVRAPYAGVISEVPVTVGDMAMPGRPLATLYDPSALRVTASVPQAAADAAASGGARIELPALPAGQKSIKPARVTVLPAADAATHTVEVRFDLPSASGVVPGMFARAWLPATTGATPGRVYVPATAVVRRAELTGVYVITGDGRALLRQVRLGRAIGDKVEILAGVSSGERVALDPTAAGRTP